MLFRIIIVSVISLALSLSIYSQDTVKTYYLGEVEVTAHRGGGEVLNLPMAVSFLDLSDLVLKRKAGLSDIINKVPGVLVQSRAGSYDVRLSVRGFGSRGYGDKSNAGTIRGVKILVDDFPESEPDGRTSLDFVEPLLIERVEVIKTNASALFGNASGGIVNFETTSMGDARVELTGIYGSFGLVQTALKSKIKFASGELNLLGSTLDFNGWRENSSVKRKQVYSSLKTELSEKANLKVISGFVSNLFYIPGPLTLEQFTSNPHKANEIYLSRQERKYNRIGRLGLNLTSSLKQHTFDVRLYLVPKVIQRSERGTFRDFNRYFIGAGITYQYYRDDVWIKPKFTFGYDDSYQDGTILFYNLVNGERGDSLRTNKREAGRANGFFARFEIQPLENLFIVTGARYDMQNYISEIYPAGVKRTTQRDLLKMRHLTPSFSVLYKAGKNNSLYFTISGGLETPAFNEVDPPPELKNVSLNPLLKPMVSQTFELGFKGVSIFNSPFISDLIYSIAFFRINVKDELVPYDNGKWFFSAGESMRNGLEFGGGINFINVASLNLALTWIDAKYVKYENDLGDLSGKLIPGIPKLWGGAELKVDVKPFKFSIEFIYVGRYYADDSNEIEIPSYALLNMYGGVELKISNLKFSFISGVNNLTNKNYVASAFMNPERSGRAYIEPGLPRNWFLGISIRME